MTETPAQSDGREETEDAPVASAPSTEPKGQVLLALIDLLGSQDAVNNLSDAAERILDKAVRRSGQNQKYELLALFLVIAAIVGLSAVERLNPSAGVVLGSLAGYLFGHDRP